MSYDQGWDQSRRAPGPSQSVDQAATSGGAPSFKTNVNRNKTKRWVEAKSFSYDGDDWGEVDDYDEYGAGENHPPSPRGPSAANVPEQRANPIPTAVPSSSGVQSDTRKGYGALPGQASNSTEQPQNRSVTQPLSTNIKRINSFDVGDDRRVLSATQPGPPPQGHPSQRQPPPIATRPQAPKTFSQIGVSPTGVVASPQTWTPVSSQSQKPMPNPSQGRPSAPSSAVEPPSNTKFPPRKSSLSRNTPPPVSGAAPTLVNPSTSSEATPKPGQPGDRGRSGSIENQPRAFVRPADIYKRINEEREKERKSLESSRSSMESLTGGKTGDGTTRSRSGSQELPSTDRPTRGTSPASNMGGENDSGKKLMPMLEPVQERKSEYGFDGFVVDQSQPAKSVGSSSNPLSARKPPPASASSNLPKKEEEKKDTSPRLPTVSRVSGFGDDFFSTAGISSQSSITPTQDSRQLQSNSESAPRAADADLHHQPSQGFRSVVNQAFDKTDDLKSVPQTPSSRDGSQVSQASSGVRRADTGSSSGISPIISRNPSGANPSQRGQDGSGDHPITSVIAEEPSEGAEMASARSEHAGTLENAGSKKTPPFADQSDPLPPTFKPGHRRDLSTPSPNNSPARSPIIEGPENIVSGKDAEISHAGSPTAKSAPLESNKSLLFNTEKRDAKRGEGLDYSLREADIATVAKTSPDIKSTGVNDAEKAARDAFLETHDPSDNNAKKDGNFVAPTPPQIQPSTNAKGSGALQEPKNESLEARPTADRNASFRPVLPGGWQSYAPTPDGDAIPNPLEKVVLHERGNTSLMPTPLNRRMDSGELSLKTPRMPVQRLDSASSGVTMTSDAGPSPYSSNAIDPRLDQGTTQDRNLRPSQLQHSVSSDSSVPPTPPPKNTPPVGARASNNADYFAAPPPLQQKAVKQSAAQKELPPPIRSQELPAMSTDASPQDQESDKLRKEIVKSLSPQSAEPPPVDFNGSKGASTTRVRSDASRLTQASFGSTGLPSEYDSYWAATDEGADVAEKGSVRTVGRSSVPASEAPLQSNKADSPLDSMSKDHLSKPTISSKEMPLDASSSPRPGLLPSRFSWETEPEANRSPITTNATASKDIEKFAAPSSNHQNPQANVQETDRSTIPEGLELADEAHHADIYHSAPEVVPGFENTSPTKNITEHDPGSASDEKNFGRYMDNSFENHQSTETLGQNPNVTMDNSSTTRLSDRQSPVGPGIHSAPPPTAPSRIPAFREIAAIKSPGDRINAFKETQDQYANMDTGLSQWILQTVNSHPDHAHFRNGVNAASTAPSLGQGTSPGRLQTLNTANTSQSPVSAGRSTVPSSSNSPAGTSPGGPKISGQQVQVKGKELLHNAGVFGGKANTAAKGLFAKGKSKLRGSEKESPPQSPYQSGLSSPVSSEDDLAEAHDHDDAISPVQSRAPSPEQHSKLSHDPPSPIVQDPKINDNSINDNRPLQNPHQNAHLQSGGKANDIDDLYDISTDDGDESLADFEKPIELERKQSGSEEQRNIMHPNVVQRQTADGQEIPVSVDQALPTQKAHHTSSTGDSFSPMPFEHTEIGAIGVKETIEDHDKTPMRVPSPVNPITPSLPQNSVPNSKSAENGSERNSNSSQKPQDNPLQRERSLSFESTSHDQVVGPPQDYLPGQIRSASQGRESQENRRESIPQTRATPIPAGRDPPTTPNIGTSSVAIPVPYSSSNIPLEQRLKSTVPAQGSPLAFAKTPDTPSPPLESETKKQTKPGKRASFFGFLGSKTPKHYKNPSVARSSQPNSQIQMVKPISERQEIEPPMDEPKKEKVNQARRSGLFNRLSGNEQAHLKPPGSQESLIAHSSGSRTDLLKEEHPFATPRLEQSPASTPKAQSSPASQNLTAVATTQVPPKTQRPASGVQPQQTLTQSSAPTPKVQSPPASQNLTAVATTQVPPETQRPASGVQQQQAFTQPPRPPGPPNPSQETQNKTAAPFKDAPGDPNKKAVLKKLDRTSTSNIPNKQDGKKIDRTSTSSIPNKQDGKKKRFSTFSSMFGRSATPGESQTASKPNQGSPQSNVVPGGSPPNNNLNTLNQQYPVTTQGGNQGRIIVPPQGPPYQQYRNPNAYPSGPQMQVGTPQGQYMQGNPQMQSPYHQMYNTAPAIPQGQFQPNYYATGTYPPNQYQQNVYPQQAGPQYPYQQPYGNMPNQPQMNPYFNQARQGSPQQAIPQGNYPAYQQNPASPQNLVYGQRPLHPLHGYYAPSPDPPPSAPQNQIPQSIPPQQEYQNQRITGSGMQNIQQNQRNTASTAAPVLPPIPRTSPLDTGNRSTENESPPGKFDTPPIPAPYQAVVGSQGTSPPKAPNTDSNSSKPQTSVEDGESKEEGSLLTEQEISNAKVPDRANTIARSATTVSAESQSNRLSPEMTNVSNIDHDSVNRETATGSPVSDSQTSRTQSIRDQTGSLKRAREQHSSQNLAIPNDMASRSTEKFRPEEFHQLVEERSNSSSGRQSIIQENPDAVSDTKSSESNPVQEEIIPATTTEKRSSPEAAAAVTIPPQASVPGEGHQTAHPPINSPTSPSQHPLPESTLSSPTDPRSSGTPPIPPPKILPDPPLPPSVPPELKRPSSRDLAVNTDTSRPTTARREDSGSEEEEEIVMSSTAFPGDTWEPVGYGQWEGD